MGQTNFSSTTVGSTLSPRRTSTQYHELIKLDTLGNDKHFASLDLASGYWQIAVEGSACEKTAFATFGGLYEFTVLLFGLTNAPATFCVQWRLHWMVYCGIIVLFTWMTFRSVDPRLIWAPHLPISSPERIREAGLKVKLCNRQFGKEDFKFLGHIISRWGVSPDPTKIQAIHKYPTPSNYLVQLKQFLQLASYYWCIVKDFSAVAAPLNALTSTNAQWVWTPVCHSALWSKISLHHLFWPFLNLANHSSSKLMHQTLALVLV